MEKEELLINKIKLFVGKRIENIENGVDPQELVGSMRRFMSGNKERIKKLSKEYNLNEEEALLDFLKLYQNTFIERYKFYQLTK